MILLAHQLRHLGDIRRDPPRLQTHLRIHKPVVVLPAEHPAPSGAPAEQTTETSASSSLQLTVPSPLTIRRPALPAEPARPWRTLVAFWSRRPWRTLIAFCSCRACRTLIAFCSFFAGRPRLTLRSLWARTGNE